jgi:DNA repair protein RecN (Recombination protein N)
MRQEYADAYETLQATRARIAEISSGRALAQQQLELYQFQAAEIDAAELSPGEYAELTARASVLGNLEKLKRDVGLVHSALYENDGSVLEKLRMMCGVLGELSNIDGQLASASRALRDATIQLEEVAFDLTRYIDRLDLDPSELAEVNERLNTLNRLLHKYSDDEAATLAYRQELSSRIQELQRAGDDLSTHQKQLGPLTARLRTAGEKLSEARAAAARRLAPLVMAEMAELGMEKASFNVALTQAPMLDGLDLPATPSGFDQAEFIAQTNPGQLAQPLRKMPSRASSPRPIA